MTENTENKKRCWFVLGHEPKLSLAEIGAVIGTIPTLLTQDIAASNTKIDSKSLISRLGGTIKIAEELAVALDETSLLNAIATELQNVEGKIHFGLSLYAIPNGAKQAEQWGLGIKKRLKTDGLSVRYVDNRGQSILSSVSVEKNGLVARGREFLIVPEGRLFRLAKTMAVQPFESFGERDFGRPGRDDVSGMLPPKLAMMMINCAGAPKDKIIYDPSCGSGTILSEALLLGYSSIAGSDISAKAVEDTKQNIAWMLNKNTKTPKLQIFFEHDIKKLPTHFDTKKLGGIVSEPYMGPPLNGRETTEQLQKSADELTELYLATFRSLAHILPHGATVVYIFPRFSLKIRTAELVLPEIKKLGFKVIPLLPTELSKDPYILYQRDNQRVGREIWRFSF